MTRSTFVRGGSQLPSVWGGTLPMRRCHHALSLEMFGRFSPIATAAYNPTLSTTSMVKKVGMIGRIALEWRSRSRASAESCEREEELSATRFDTPWQVPL